MNYQITPALLETIKKITREVTILNNQSFTQVVLHEMELDANAQSSFSSTSIEGNPLPLTEVKRLLKNHPQRVRQTEREVLNYNAALLWLKKQLSTQKFKFGSQFICEIHKKVMADLMIRSKTGRYRMEPVFVNDPRQKKTIYWPPDHEDVPSLMQNLIRFVQINFDQMDPIILAGLFHRQFVIIHPFIDGNGRTVRLATKALLASLGIDTFYLFSFENYYNQNVSVYFQKVGVRGNYYDIIKKLQFTEWLEYFAAGILDEIWRVQKILFANQKILTAIVPPLIEDQQKILDFLRIHGSIRDKDYAKFTMRAKATRALDLKKLVQHGLIERKGRGPGTYYVLKS